MAHPAENFLHLKGFIHSIDLSPAGTLKDPWPFCLIADNGVSEVTALLEREDAEKLVEFLTRHLEVTA